MLFNFTLRERNVRPGTNCGETFMFRLRESTLINLPHWLGQVWPSIYPIVEDGDIYYSYQYNGNIYLQLIWYVHHLPCITNGCNCTLNYDQCSLNDDECSLNDAEGSQKLTKWSPIKALTRCNPCSIQSALLCFCVSSFICPWHNLLLVTSALLVA
jgi:hypothetical protein